MQVFFSPLGRWLAAAVLSLALIGAAYVKGRIDRAKIDESETLRARVHALEMARQISESALSEANRRAEAREVDLDEARRKVADYEAELAKPPADGSPPPCDCGLRGNDLRILRDTLGPYLPAPAGPSRNVR